MYFTNMLNKRLLIFYYYMRILISFLCIYLREDLILSERERGDYLSLSST